MFSRIHRLGRKEPLQSMFDAFDFFPDFVSFNMRGATACVDIFVIQAYYAARVDVLSKMIFRHLAAYVDFIPVFFGYGFLSALIDIFHSCKVSFGVEVCTSCWC